MNDPESIAQKIDRLALETGRAMADAVSQYLTGPFDETILEEQGVDDFIFRGAAIDVLDKFSNLKNEEKRALRNSVIRTVRSAFKKRLAELLPRQSLKD